MAAKQEDDNTDRPTVGFDTTSLLSDRTEKSETSPIAKVATAEPAVESDFWPKEYKVVNVYSVGIKGLVENDNELWTYASKEAQNSNEKASGKGEGKLEMIGDPRYGLIEEYDSAVKSKTYEYYRTLPEKTRTITEVKNPNVQVIKTIKKKK